MHHIDRRRFLTLLALPALASLIPIACGDDDAATGGGGGAAGGGGATPGPEGPEAGVDLVRFSTTAAEADPAVASLNQLGFDLYRTLAETPDANLVFSPASIAIALAMTSAGAAGTTAAEFADVLRIEDPAIFHRGFNALDAALATRNGEYRNASGEPGEVTLSIANSLWGQHGLAFEDAFLELLATEYGAGMNLVDYAADPEGARTRINAWVDEATRERIPQLLAEGVITGDTRLTLVNAIYLKAPWLQAFAPEATAPGAFTTLDGATVEVPLMQASTFMAHARGDGWEAVQLPFVGEQLAMTMIVPDEGRFAELDSSLDAATLASVVEALSPAQVSLTMPSFDIETQAALSEVLGSLGLAEAFDPTAADFSAMTAEEQLFISAVIHQANITVDEEGAEAAAATAVVADTTSAPAEPVVVRIDRPFLFALRDTGTGAVVFLGRIGDPAQRRNA